MTDDVYGLKRSIYSMTKHFFFIYQMPQKMIVKCSTVGHCFWFLCKHSKEKDFYLIFSPLTADFIVNLSDSVDSIFMKTSPFLFML